MRYVVAVLLFLVFVYSLLLVVTNNHQVDVNLLFSQVPQMNLGLLLIISILLGLLAGILLGVILFRVLQTKLENQRLNKELMQTREKLIQTQHNLEEYLKQHQDSGMALSKVNNTSNLPSV